jgi:hypothetical protein
MSVEILCDECGASYLCCTQNTRVYGPLIEITCPKCNTLVVRNMSKFMRTQTDGKDYSKIEQAKLMIAMAQQIGKDVNDDTPYSKRRKKK